MAVKVDMRQKEGGMRAFERNVVSFRKEGMGEGGRDNCQKTL